MYSQEECDVDVEHIERERSQLRILFLAGQTEQGRMEASRLDGMQYKAQDDILLKEISRCQQRVNFSKFQWAQKMAKAKLKEATKKYGPAREHWRRVTAEEAVALRQKGFATRCTGVKTWEVFE